MKRVKIGMLGMLLAGLMVASTAVAAQADRNTSMSGWRPGSASSSWADSNATNVSTRVRLSSVNVYLPYTPLSATPSSVQLELQYDQWGVGWVGRGSRTSAPGILHTWANPGSGTYRFRLSGWTSSGQWFGTGTDWRLNAGAVFIGW
jgi:hypothetical protein